MLSIILLHTYKQYNVTPNWYFHAQVLTQSHIPASIWALHQQGTRNRGQNVSLSTSTIPSYGEFEPGPRQASSPLTPDSPKQFLNHVDRGVYVIKDLSVDPEVVHQTLNPLY